MHAEPQLRSAIAEDAADLAALWARAFAPPLSPDQWLVDPDRLAHTIVAVDADGVVGSIYGLPKRLRVVDGVAAVHGIGSVAVAERARGRGLARRLVSASVESARRAGADWALLFTDTPEVYRSSGFEPFTMHRAARGPWAALGGRGSARRTTIGPGTLASSDAVYEQSREGLVLAPVRSAIEWTMAEVRLHGMTLYTIDSDGAPVAYAVAGVQQRTGILAELAASATAPAGAREALLGAIGQDWSESRVEHCDIAAPQRADDIAAVRAFAPLARWTTDATGMTLTIARQPRLDGVRHFGAADYF